jgi:hypothetical protein
MEQTTLTLGHSPDPDEASLFYALAKKLIPMFLALQIWLGKPAQESIRRFPGQGFERGFLPHRQELEFVG